MSWRPTEKRISKQLGGEVITVVVGEAEHHQKFYVHQDLVCSCSEFFHNAMGGKWKESEDRVVPLPEDNPEVFLVYLQACYAGNVKIEHDESEMEHDVWDEAPCCSSDFTLWANVYALAEKLMDVPAKNVVTRAFFDNEAFYLAK